MDSEGAVEGFAGSARGGGTLGCLYMKSVFDPPRARTPPCSRSSSSFIFMDYDVCSSWCSTLFFFFFFFSPFPISAPLPGQMGGLIEEIDRERGDLRNILWHDRHTFAFPQKISPLPGLFGRLFFFCFGLPAR